jgi:large subunit ribosomal protein L32e
MAEKNRHHDEFMKLHMFKEEYISRLEEFGIESPADLAEALADEERTEDLLEHMKGVGPKTIERWREDLSVEEDAEDAPEPEKTRKVGPASESEESEEDEEEEEDEEVEIDEEEDEVEIEDEEEEGYKVKLKPELSKDVLDALGKRSLVDSKRPDFKRQEYHRRKRLQRTGWRRPRGLHSKMRRHMGYRGKVVRIGYGGPKAVRHLHPSGFAEVVVHNVADLEKIDPKVQAARVAHTVGMRKRTQIEDRADEMKIRILNRSG